MFESKENRNKLVSRQKQHTGLFNFHPPFAFHQNISMRKSEDTLKIVFPEHSSSFFFYRDFEPKLDGNVNENITKNISLAIINLWRLLLFVNFYQYEGGRLGASMEKG